MFRKAMMMVLTVLSGIDIGLIWTGGKELVDPVVQTEINQIYASSQPSVPVNGQPAPTLNQPGTDGTGNPEANWVALKSAAPFLNPLTADGAIELVQKQQVVLLVDGVVVSVNARVGDEVQAGDLLITLDSSDLARAVDRAELDLTTAQSEMKKLQQGSSQGEIDAAQASLDAANANLEKAQRGASQAELDAAKSKVTAAQVRYRELSGPPSGAEIDEVQAELEKAQIAVQTARRAYDAIGGSGRADIGTTPESQRLYEATVELERVQAKYNRVNQGSSQSSLQDAVSNIERAKAELAELEAKPNPADIADAQAKVKEVEERLAKLVQGASASERESAKIKVEKAELDLEEAKLRLQSSQIVAPIAGTVLELNVSPGERGAIGKVVATLADTKQLKLTVKVAEVDIARITPGQPVSITLDALRGSTFNGIVESIAPTNQENKDVVNYPVNIRLTDPNNTGIRPGMTAQVKLSEAASETNSWLVPQNSILRLSEGGELKVRRGEAVQTVHVEIGETYGEWIVVKSPELQENDVVQGSVTSGATDAG